jgi:hypothetical protein
LKTVERDHGKGANNDKQYIPNWRPEVDREITSLVCVYDPNKLNIDPPQNVFFSAVGWDKRVRSWNDN